MKIKAITLWQPWATLIAIGAKRIETRSWSTPYRGLLAIHAAKGFPKEAQQLCGIEPFWKPLDALLPKPAIGELFPTNRIQQSLPRGAIVAICELAFVVRINDTIATGKRPIFHHGDQWVVTDQERAFGDYTTGRYAWLLRNIRAINDPIPAKGMLGLWDIDLPEEVLLGAR